MVRAIAVYALVALVACGDDGTGPDRDAAPDQRDGGSDAPVAGGLTFEFTTQPALPDVATDLTVDELRIVLHDVRAIGDAAPGDARTSVAQLSLEWRPGSETPRQAFPAAPPGIYSSFAARLGGPTEGERRFEIRGLVRVAGVLHTFRIENDDVDVRIAVDLGGLTVGAVPRTATLSVSLAFLAAVDWSQVGTEDGELRIESADPQMAAIVSGLAVAFSLADVR